MQVYLMGGGGGGGGKSGTMIKVSFVIKRSDKIIL